MLSTPETTAFICCRQSDMSAVTTSHIPRISKTSPFIHLRFSLARSEPLDCGFELARADEGDAGQRQADGCGCCRWLCFLLLFLIEVCFVQGVQLGLAFFVFSYKKFFVAR